MKYRKSSTRWSWYTGNVSGSSTWGSSRSCECVCLCFRYVTVGVNEYLPRPCHSSDSCHDVLSPLSFILYDTPHFTLLNTSSRFFDQCGSLFSNMNVLWSVYGFAVCVLNCIIAYKTSGPEQVLQACDNYFLLIMYLYLTPLMLLTLI